MMNVMTYNSYTARVEFDPHDQLFMGRVLGIRDGISFHGETVAELTADFHAAIDHYLEDCAKTGRAPDRPVSGRLMLSVPPDVHRAALIAAESAGKSLNQWATETLTKATLLTKEENAR